MGSVGAILTLGYGSWGSVGEVLTLGYGSSTVVVVEGPFELEASQTYAASIVGQTYAASIEARQARPE